MDKKEWYIYTMEYYAAIKKQNNTICSNMDEPRNYHTKSDRERQISYGITYLWNLKIRGTNELICRTEIESQI